MEDYYKILGLKLGATLDEIEKTYRQLLKEFDPETQADDDLKAFFKSEQDKIKEAYKEISSKKSVAKKSKKVLKKVAEKSPGKKSKKVLKKVVEKSPGKKSKKVVKKAAVKSPVKKSNNKSHQEKGKKFSITPEIELNLKRAYLIMFVLGFPSLLLISRNFGNILDYYWHDILLMALFHFLGAIFVLLIHVGLIVRSSGFKSVKKSISVFFVERKKYFTRILALTPLVLVFLHMWGGMNTYSDGRDYWYNSYQDIKSKVSGDDYDSGCNTRKALKIHNQSTQDLYIAISYRKKNGNWSEWGWWQFPVGRYNGIRSDNEEHNGGTIYTSDYRYYIETLDSWPYLYSRDIPHLTNTCNAKCINIY